MASTWARSARSSMPFASGKRFSTCSKKACGARLTYSYLTVGGATPICRRAGCQVRKAFLKQLEPVIVEYHTLLTTNAIFVRRTAGIGMLAARDGDRLRLHGPVLRGSGVDHDLRRDGEERYTEMYDGYAFEVIVEKKRPLSQGPQLSAGAFVGRAWAIAGIGSTCGCWKSCNRSIWCARRSTATARPRLVGRAGQAERKTSQGRSVSGNRSPRGQMGFYRRQPGRRPSPGAVRARQQLLLQSSR
jgi:NADH-quinone oxidoreductase subunit D